MYLILITKTEAKALGLTRYYTGEPCKYGHISERLTCNSTCVVCNRTISHKNSIKYKKTSKKYRDYIKKYRRRAEVVGKDRLISKRYREKNSEKIKVYRKDYYERTKEKNKEKRREYVKQNKLSYRIYASKRRSKLKNGSYTKDDVINILKNQDNKCVYCKKNLDDGYHVDHIYPLSKGGDNTPKNIQITCPSCNGRKKDKLPEYFAREIGYLI